MAKKKSFENIISNILGEPVSNLCHAFYDQYVEANVRFRSRAGMKELIIRRQLGKCCKWCADLAGIYTPENAPADIYRRHDNCKCMVTYKDENGYTDVWSKKEYETQKEARRAREYELLEDRKKEKKILQKRLNKIVDILKTSRYNTLPTRNKVQKLFAIYEKDVKDGWISPLFSFSEYVELYNRVEREIIGKTTVDGVHIKEQSVHFLQRVIGTRVDPKIYKETHTIIKRNGVEFEDIVETLFEGKAEPPRYDEVHKRWSKRYKGSKCAVTINPETGTLIQCNPRKPRKNGKV